MQVSLEQIEVGMGLTEVIGSDRRPGTITKVSPSGKTIEYTLDEVLRTDDNGMSEQQDYVFLTNDDAPSYVARYSAKKDRFYATGRPVTVGVRSYYHDFSF